MATLKNPIGRGRIVDEPKFAKFLFSDTRSSVIWLVVRVLLGIDWVNAASHKVTEQGWLTGTSLKATWERMIADPVGTAKPAISIDWYRNFIKSLYASQSWTWFGPLVAYGELFVGIGLIVGAFTGIAAFFGTFMNWNFMMAGTASTNPWMMAVGGLVILAWKVAGYIGADFFLLRWLGVPWRGEDAPAKAVPAPSAGK